MTADKISVGELATTQIVALPPVPLCSELVEALQRCPHEALPITPEVAKAFQSGMPSFLRRSACCMKSAHLQRSVSERASANVPLRDRRELVTNYGPYKTGVALIIAVLFDGGDAANLAGLLHSLDAISAADSAFQLDGVVTRSQLLRLLKHRIGFFVHKQGAKLPSSKASIPATQVGTSNTCTSYEYRIWFYLCINSPVQSAFPLILIYRQASATKSLLKVLMYPQLLHITL